MNLNLFKFSAGSHWIFLYFCWLKNITSTFKLLFCYRYIHCTYGTHFVFLSKKGKTCPTVFPPSRLTVEALNCKFETAGNSCAMAHHYMKINLIDGRHVPEAKVGSRGVFCTTVIKVSFSFYVESLIDMNNYSNGAQVHHAALSFRNESEGCLSILPAVWLDFHEAVAMALLAWAISTKYRFVWKMFFQLVWIVLNLLTFLQGQTNVPNLIG